MPPANLANIFTGFLMNAMPFQYAWACFFLSVSTSTWMPVAALCHHPVSVILHAIKVAIHKCCSRTVQCVDASIQSMAPQFCYTFAPSWIPLSNIQGGGEFRQGRISRGKFRH